ncbi:hypothetical protein JW796_03305 [Candidatus Dojkabacteria bacterium]|nr:hypothetical protein [Candidatus Dojkabacteria bacterium]
MISLKIFKIFLFTNFFLLFSFFLGGHSTSAASFSQEFSSIYTINSDLSANVTFREVFVNISSTEVLDRYKVNIPFADATDISVKVNGSGTISGHKVTGGRTEVSVDFDPVIKDQTAVILTSFKTYQVAKDFGGITALLIPSVDSGVKISNQAVNVSKSLGELSCASTDFTKGKETKQNIYNFNSSSNIYMTFGNSVKYNFSLKQSLINNTSKEVTTKFLLPYEDSRQSLYFYFSNYDAVLVSDGSNNKEIFVSLKPTENKSIGINGLLSSKNTDREIVESKVKDIYKKVISEHSPSSDSRFERKSIGELKEQKSLSEIQYADLLVSLLKEKNIDAKIIIGRNNGARMFGRSEDIDAWVSYFDESSKNWQGLDPYFADSNNLGDEPFFNPDRIAYFVLDGSKAEESYGYYFLEGQGFYVELSKYDGDEFLIDKSFDYTVTIDPIDKVSLDVHFPVSIKLANRSSRAIRIKDAHYKGKKLEIRARDKNLWVLPGHSARYQIEGLMVKGLFGEKKQTFELSLSIESAGGEIQNQEKSIEITALPTVRTFLPLMVALTVLSVSFFLFLMFKKHIKLTHKR